MKERKTEITKEFRKKEEQRRKGRRKDAQKRKGKVEEDLHGLTIGIVRKEKERPWTQRDKDLKEKFKVGPNSCEETWQLLKNVAAAEDCFSFWDSSC